MLTRRSFLRRSAVLGHHREPGLRAHHAAVRSHLLLSSTLAGVSFTRALRQAVPLYGVYFLVISVIIFFPDVVLWLPRLIVPTSVGCFPNPSGRGFICPP